MTGTPLRLVVFDYEGTLVVPTVAGGSPARDVLVDTMRGVLTRLDSQGLLLAIATNRSRRGLTASLDHHALTALFRETRTPDDGPSKPHPSMLLSLMDAFGVTPTDTVMIGDTRTDMAMAREARVSGIGVTWGYEDAHALREAGAARVVERPGQIPDALAAAWPPAGPAPRP